MYGDLHIDVLVEAWLNRDEIRHWGPVVSTLGAASMRALLPALKLLLPSLQILLTLSQLLLLESRDYEYKLKGVEAARQLLITWWNNSSLLIGMVVDV